MEIIIIAAVARNGVIGNQGKIPWHFSEDFRHFKRATQGHAVIMGRATFESIGKPLPDRLNVVLTRNKGYGVPEGVVLAPALEAALAYCESHGQAKAFIIGGAAVYAEAMGKGLANTLVISEVKREFAGDARFPAIDRKIWEETSREPHPEFDVVTYARTPPQAQPF